MSDTDVHGRSEPPAAGDETTTLLAFLDHQRATFAWKVRGLDARALRVTVGASSMTLGGLMKHLAYVEQDWFRCDLQGNPRREPWASVDWKADPDWEWHSAAGDSPDDLFALWEDTVSEARGITAVELGDGGLDTLTRRVSPDGRQFSLRWVLLHMIEEYARHNGHADLIREYIDGQVGE